MLLYMRCCSVLKPPAPSLGNGDVAPSASLFKIDVGHHDEKWKRSKCFFEKASLQ